MEVSPETKEQLSRAAHVKAMTESPGWQIIEASLKAKIIDLQMIGNVEGITAEEKMKNMEARMIAVAIFFEWLKQDVYGIVEQAEVAKGGLVDAPTDSFIDRQSA